METAVISYRVADFLKKQPPFNALDDADLLALAARGRVRFHEPNEYILWQGEPHRQYVFVIQQGTVSMWDEEGDRFELRDVRGAGDLLGLERFHGAPSILLSARSESDVVIYAFPAEDFESVVLKHPHAAQFVAAEGRVPTDYQPTGGRRDPHRTYLHALAGGRPLATCSPGDTIAEAAAQALAARASVVAVIVDGDRLEGVLTPDSFLRWIVDGGGEATQPVSRLLQEAPAIVGPNASAADGVLALGAGTAGALAITTDGTPGGRLQALLGPGDFSLLFGEQPATLLRDIRLASTRQELRDLNQRARALILEFLHGAGAAEWLARFAHQVDVALVTRLLDLGRPGGAPGCWCFCGSSGRGESLTLLAPLVVVIADGEDERVAASEAHQQLIDALAECDYLPRGELPFDAPFYVATAADWAARFRNWVRDPVMQRMYRSRTMFDLRPVYGRRELWERLESDVMEAVNTSFLFILANDCLASLPPLTFFQDAVVDSVGERVETFHVEHSALRPLVDVGRVFGMAARQVMGRSTLERLAIARTLIPEQEAIFREAADTFRVVLWQQGRVGISQGTTGIDLPPALLSRHDRHVLKSGFRSILRLLELTTDGAWLKRL